MYRFVNSSWNFLDFLIFTPKTSTPGGVGVNICIAFLGSSWHFPDFCWIFDPLKSPLDPPGWGGSNLFRFECFPDQSAHACQLWLQSEGSVERRGGGYIHTDRQTDRQTYIADLYSRRLWAQQHEHLKVTSNQLHNWSVALVTIC